MYPYTKHRESLIKNAHLTGSTLCPWSLGAMTPYDVMTSYMTPTAIQKKFWGSLGVGVRCIRQFTELPAKDALLKLTHGLLYPRKNEVYIVSICIIFVSTAFSNSQRVLLPFGFLIWDSSIAALAQVEIETDLRQSQNSQQLITSLEHLQLTSELILGGCRKSVHWHFMRNERKQGNKAGTAGTSSI